MWLNQSASLVYFDKLYFFKILFHYYGYRMKDVDFFNTLKVKIFLKWGFLLKDVDFFYTWLTFMVIHEMICGLS